MNKYKIKILKDKIRIQIGNHQEEMDKKNNKFDFYEGRKIEAEVILGWIEEMEI